MKMKTRLEIAKEINYRGSAIRTISVGSKLDIKVGDEYKFYREVESWQGDNSYSSFEPLEDGIEYAFEIDEIEGHEVNYEDEEECEVLGAIDCMDEGEVLITSDKRMRIKYISTDEDYKEMGYYSVELELI